MMVVPQDTFRHGRKAVRMGLKADMESVRWLDGIILPKFDGAVFKGEEKTKRNDPASIYTSFNMVTVVAGAYPSYQPRIGRYCKCANSLRLSCKLTSFAKRTARNSLMYTVRLVKSKITAAGSVSLS